MRRIRERSRGWPSLNETADFPMIEAGVEPRRHPRGKGSPVTTRARSAIVQHVLDVPAERLAAVVGSWAEPSILESGPGFGDAGRWSVPRGTAAPGLRGHRDATGRRHRHEFP